MRCSDQYGWGGQMPLFLLKAGTAFFAGASVIKRFHGGSGMDDLIRVLEEMRKELRRMKNDLRKLKEVKKSTLPDGWRIISGAKNRTKKFWFL
jgi:hypothetical protein